MIRKLRPARLAPLTVLLSFAAVDASADICRVTTSGTSSGTGADWSTSLDLGAALATPACTEVWVAKGLYRQPAGTDVETSFSLRADVAVYGGFAGTETLRGQRNVTANVTVLSGDMLGDDPSVDGILADGSQIVGTNTKHVVKVRGAGPATVLDGFTITAGDANSGSQAMGGGFFCDAFGSAVCTPTLANLVFVGNRAIHGGAIANDGGSGGNASPTLRDVRFAGNVARLGGAMANIAANGASNPVLDRVSFVSNRAESSGGAIANLADAGVRVGNSTFAFNAALGESGGAGEGGAVHSSGNSANTSDTFYNVTFHGNVASRRGGAVYALAVNIATVSSTKTLTFENVTFSQNRAGNFTAAGHAIRTEDGTGTTNLHLRNTIVWGNGGEFDDETVILSPARYTFDRGVFEVACSACTNTTTADPKLQPLRSVGGSVPVLLLGAGSSATDAGDNAVCAGANVAAIDARGAARPVGAGCDIGAVERTASDDALFADPLFGHGFE